MQVPYEDGKRYHDTLERQEHADHGTHAQGVAPLESQPRYCVGKHGGNNDDHGDDHQRHLKAVHEIRRDIERGPRLDVVLPVEYLREAKGIRDKYLAVILERIEEHPHYGIETDNSIKIKKYPEQD